MEFAHLHQNSVQKSLFLQKRSYSGAQHMKQPPGWSSAPPSPLPGHSPGIPGAPRDAERLSQLFHCWVRGPHVLEHPAAAAAAKSLQSCPTLWDPIDGSPPGFPIPGILQARTLEWVAISFSNAWKWKVKVKSLSRIWLFVTPWTAAYQAPPSMGFSRHEYWSGVPLPSPRTPCRS